MKKIKIYLLLFILVGFSSSCGDFDDTNTDYNNLPAISSDLLLTGSEKRLMDYTNSSFIGASWTFLTAQYWSLNNYTEPSRYQPASNMASIYANAYYSEMLMDLQEIIEIEKNNPNKADAANRTAVARVLKVWMYHYMTDLWGPIPYSEALKGAANRTPKYDAQKDIYLDLIKELKESIAQIREGESGFSNADVIYHGDLKLWKKFANSLILRIAMRMSDVEPTIAKAEVEKAAAGAFLSNADNAYFTYLTGQPNNNPLHAHRVERGDADFCMSNVFIDNTLSLLNDPRLSAIAEKATDGKYKGRPFGQTSQEAAAEAPLSYSQPSGASAVRDGVAFGSHDVLAPNASFAYMDYAEVCFIMAEAKERGWNVTGTAEEWYNKAITASINEWGIADATEIEKYLKQKEVAYTTAQGSWQQKIGVQKWIALYPDGMQGWAEWRRLDFDKFIKPVGGAIEDIGTKNAPLRLPFSFEEQTKNAVSYEDALKLLNGKDDLKTRLWWDVK